MLGKVKKIQKKTKQRKSDLNKTTTFQLTPSLHPHGAGKVIKMAACARKKVSLTAPVRMEYGNEVING